MNSAVEEKALWSAQELVGGWSNQSHSRTWERRTQKVHVRPRSEEEAGLKFFGVLWCEPHPHVYSFNVPTWSPTPPCTCTSYPLQRESNSNRTQPRDHTCLCLSACVCVPWKSVMPANGKPVLEVLLNGWDDLRFFGGKSFSVIGAKARESCSASHEGIDLLFEPLWTSSTF